MKRWRSGRIAKEDAQEYHDTVFLAKEEEVVDQEFFDTVFLIEAAGVKNLTKLITYPIAPILIFQILIFHFLIFQLQKTKVKS